MSKGSFYITTTLPYVNAEPHIGFAMELVRADIIARSKKMQGFDIFFNTGTDEHGQKIYQNAVEKGVDVKEYVDGHAATFKDLINLLGISPEIHFIRTTDEHHVAAAQEFWKRCDAAGDIYKKKYSAKYCVGCELEKTDSELVDGRCPVHPNRELEIREEENYFFRFSKYQKSLLEFYEKNPSFVVPDFRFNEIKSFVERGLEDFSISRLKEKMPWGVPVPGDETQVMYVWFDALVNYISTLGWPEDKENFEKFWQNGTPVQYAGKDNLRQQSAMWQAMLMSAGLPNSSKIVINGFITADGGVKMSKSLGNTVSPKEIVDEYGVDALRYFLARELSTFEDSPFTKERFQEAYNGNLVNGLGNLVSRLMKLAEDYLEDETDWDNHGYHYGGYYGEKISEYRIDLVADYIWDKIRELDQKIQREKPWETKDKEVIKNLVLDLYRIGCALKPFLPNTAEKIIEATKTNKKPDNLFPRLNA